MVPLNHCSNRSVTRTENRPTGRFFALGWRGALGALCLTTSLTALGLELETRLEVDSYVPFAPVLSLQDQKPSIRPGDKDRGWVDARAETRLRAGQWVAMTGYHLQGWVMANRDTQTVYQELTHAGELGPAARSLAYQASRINLQEAGIGYRFSRHWGGYRISAEGLFKHLWLADWQETEGVGQLSALAADQTRNLQLTYTRRGSHVAFDWPVRTQDGGFSGWSSDLTIGLTADSDYGWTLSGQDVLNRLQFAAQANTRLTSNGRLSNQTLIDTGTATLTGQNGFADEHRRLPADWQLTLNTPDNGLQPWLTWRRVAQLHWMTLGARVGEADRHWRLGWIPEQKAVALGGRYGAFELHLASDALNPNRAHALQLGLRGQWQLD